MNENTKIESLVKTAMEKVHELAAGEIVMGAPVTTADGTTVIPVSKISVGFASGGSDIPNKSGQETFGGGSGGGVSITPVAFIAVYQGEVKLLQLTANASTGNAVVDMVPQVLDKITSFIESKKAEKDNADDLDDI